MAALDPERYEVRAGRHHHRRALGARRSRPAAGDHRRQAARGHGRDGGLAGRRPGRPWAGGAGARRGHRPGADRGRRRLPGAARRLRRGRHDPGPAGDGRAALRRARVCSPAPPRWTRSSPRSCWPPPGCRRATTSSCATRRRGLRRPRRCSTRPRASGWAAGLRQAGAGGIQHRHHPGHRLGAVPRRGGEAAAVDPKVHRRGGRARPGDRVRRARRRRAGLPEASLPGRDPAAAGRRLVRLRRQVPRRRRRLRHPGRPDARADRGGAGGGPPGLPGAGLPRPGAGRLLPRHGARRQRPAGDQRGQHDARVHPDLDVRAHVGGDRRRLPRARRPAGDAALDAARAPR